MKVIGGIIAWLGGMAMLLGLLLFLLSLKNQNDLFIWTVLGMGFGIVGFVMAVVGWAMTRTPDAPDIDIGEGRRH